jgi:hypothetical protein
MIKIMTIFSLNLILLLSTTSCGDSSKNSSNIDSQNTYQHSCSHCSEGFNGNGFIKDSGGEVMSVSDSEVESYPAHYCSKSCALTD